VIVGATHIVGIVTFEAEDDSILVVHTDRAAADKVADESVQAIARRHTQILEPRHRIDLIQFPSNDEPQVTRDAACGFAVDAVPDIAGRFVSQAPNHVVL